jgi:hypothetical protein
MSTFVCNDLLPEKLTDRTATVYLRPKKTESGKQGLTFVPDNEPGRRVKVIPSPAGVATSSGGSAVTSSGGSAVTSSGGSAVGERSVYETDQENPDNQIYDEEPYKACKAMEAGVGPKVYDAWKSKTGEVTYVMENFEMNTLHHYIENEPKTLLWPEIDLALVRLYEEFIKAPTNVCHYDLHTENIAFKYNEKHVLIAKAIDWGISNVTTRDCRVEAFTMLYHDIPKKHLPQFWQVLTDAFEDNKIEV